MLKGSYHLKQTWGKAQQTGTALALVGMMAAMLAACGGKAAEENGGTTAPAPTPAESAKPVKLQVLIPGGVNMDWFMDRYGKSIQAKYPHYSFEVIESTGNIAQTIVTEKRKIDLMIGSFATYRNQFKPFELVADMSDLVQKNKFDLNKIEPAYLEMIRNLDGGKLSGLPLYDLGLLLYYNKDIFDKFGVPYPTDNMTWESLVGVATRLTRNEGGVQYRGFVTDPSHLVIGNQLSLGFVDAKGEKASLNTDAWKQYIDTMVPLYKMAGYDVTKEMITGTAIKNAFFKEKSSAMFVMYNSDAPKPDEGINWDAVSLPELKGAPGIGSQPYPVYISVSSLSENRDDAFNVIAHLLSDEVQTKLSSDFAQISPLKNDQVKAAFGKSVAQWQGKNIAAIKAKKPASPPAYVGEYNNFGQSAAANAMRSVIVGEKDVNTALRDADEEVNKKIEEAKAMKK
jgi:multiple sugar transport system substrate-binding protein